MDHRGPAAHKTAIFLLLALCLPGWNSIVAVSADFGHESSAASDKLSIFTQGIAAVYHRQTFGLALALSDFDGDHKVDVAFGRQIGNDYAIVIHLTSRPDETVLASSHLPAGLTVYADDINKDSYSDIIVASPFDVHPLAVWLGDGKGGFSAADQTRFANDFGLTTFPSYDRQSLASRQDLLSEPRRPDCEKQVFAFEDLKPKPKRFVTLAVLPDLRRTDHSPPGPRSPPDY